MKVALIIPNNLWFCPYVNIYTNILQDIGVEFDIISWNRDASESLKFQYNYHIKTRNKIGLLYAYIKYALYVKRIIQQQSYDKLIVFTPQIGIFLASYLRKFYQNNYIFDYRDLSIEQAFYFKPLFHILLKNSYINCISSPGFKQYLPKQYDYVLSHNFDINLVEEALTTTSINPVTKDVIKVLTIGGIRDYESNIQVIDALENRHLFHLAFVGKGPSASDLEKYVIAKSIKNITFTGYYQKLEEPTYIKDSTLLNIFYPRKASHDSALSNRFYNSLIYRRPMIVTKDTTQGDYVSTHNIGIAIENCNSLAEQIQYFLTNLDFDKYNEQCKKLLRLFIQDYNFFKKSINNFIYK